jgi:hypothetical protein
VLTRPDQDIIPLYRRSTFQVALLLWVTGGGLYYLWWAYFTRRWCAGTLERSENVFWKTVALIVPIFNFFLIFDLGQMIEGVLFRAQLQPARINLGIYAIVAAITNVIVGRLPGEWIGLVFVTFLPIAFLHSFTYRAEIAISGEAARASAFNAIEWIVIVLGGALQLWLFSALFARGLVIGPPIGFIVALVTLFILSKREPQVRWAYQKTVRQ